MQLTTWQKIALPVTITMIVFIMLWVTNPFIMALSFLAGSVACWLGNAFFALMLYWKIKRKKPQHFLVVYYLGEFLKLAVYAILFVIIAVVFRLHMHPMLSGFILNIVIFALLFINALGDI
jgi:F0F1-type ATP synthase assembly protein I